LRIQAYIRGQWVSADDQSTFAVMNPATNEVIAEVANAGAKEVNRAIDAACPVICVLFD